MHCLFSLPYQLSHHVAAFQLGQIRMSATPSNRMVWRLPPLLVMATHIRTGINMQSSPAKGIHLSLPEC